MKRGESLQKNDKFSKREEDEGWNKTHEGQVRNRERSYGEGEGEEWNLVHMKHQTILLDNHKCHFCMYHVNHNPQSCMHLVQQLEICEHMLERVKMFDMERETNKQRKTYDKNHNLEGKQHKSRFGHYCNISLRRHLIKYVSS